MNKIIPTIGASLMLAANVVSAEVQFDLISHETKEPADNPSIDLNLPEDTETVEGGQGVEPGVYMEPQGQSGNRIIIYDNDFVAPKYERNFSPVPRVD